MAARRTSASRDRRSSSNTRRRTASITSTRSIATRPMTTVRSSRASSATALLIVVAVSVAFGAGVSAHRRDEYLQATRLAIDPDRVQIELDLTPGIAVAEVVLAEIDFDADRSISAAEARAYADRVLSAIALDVDGMPLDVELVDSAFPVLDTMLN